MKYKAILITKGEKRSIQEMHELYPFYFLGKFEILDTYLVGDVIYPSAEYDFVILGENVIHSDVPNCYFLPCISIEVFKTIRVVHVIAIIEEVLRRKRDAEMILGRKLTGSYSRMAAHH